VGPLSGPARLALYGGVRVSRDRPARSASPLWGRGWTVLVELHAVAHSGFIASRRMYSKSRTSDGVETVAGGVARQDAGDALGRGAGDVPVADCRVAGGDWEAASTGLAGLPTLTQDAETGPIAMEAATLDRIAIRIGMTTSQGLVPGAPSKPNTGCAFETREKTPQRPVAREAENGGHHLPSHAAYLLGSAVVTGAPGRTGRRRHPYIGYKKPSSHVAEKPSPSAHAGGCCLRTEHGQIPAPTYSELYTKVLRG